ncbi:DNA-binding response regulator [Chryseobacterium carnipullorum]|uniref:DNA-binding response regulator n=1 Tax=Chryseobacterium carnipullorum TaxID=1124835 RepID=A0A376EIE8_CHRCU|nr:response regulator transcription factor [Chryseobacterium carnipullorum]AZA47333.1 DNA-binding response regulator [Chryseobacterium carnipullorum]STD09456.1 Nitrogen regulation protein C [Chryseobacterium carnipullorum]
MIKIFAYDDSQECLNSMRILIELSENMKYIGEALNCEHVEAEMEAYQPDVVLMDINMPVVDGIAGLKIIKSKFPQINVLVQTAFDDSEKVFRSISSGASGYILKSDNPRRILQAIEEIYEGGAFMNPAIAKRVLEYFQPTAEQKLLTQKEQEVLKLLSNGLSYKMIADKLEISYSTVNTHIKHIYNKLHVSSLGEAVSWYFKNIKE